jgi:hypothetical protein
MRCPERRAKLIRRTSQPAPAAACGHLHAHGLPLRPDFHEEPEMGYPKTLWQVFLHEVRDCIADYLRPLIVAIQWLRCRRK